MNGLPLLDSTFCLHSALALLHFLWQGLLLAILAYVTAWCLRNQSAGARCRVHVATLLLMLACLPASFAVLHRQEAGRSAALAAGGPGITAAVASESPFSISRASRTSVVTPLARWTTILYLLGVTGMFARMFLGLAGMRRLRRDATPLTDAGLLEAVRRHAQRVQLRHVPTVAYCRRVAVPALVGLWRPMIVLPTVLATGLTPEQLELVIVHEMAHMEPNPQIFNPARTGSPQLAPVGQVLLDRITPGEDEVFQRTDSGALRYLKRIRVDRSCVATCHASRGSVFNIGEQQHPENRLKLGDVLAVVSLEIPAEQ